MSTATAAGGRAHAQQRATGSPRPSARPPVRGVPTPHPPARAPFVVVVLLLLSLGLGALLLLNTLLAQGSFTLHSLNERVAALADQEQALQQRASELAAPQRLARRAQALGMVQSQNPAFLSAADGKVLGEPAPAAAPVQPAPVVGSVDPSDEAEPAPDAGGAAAGEDRSRDEKPSGDGGEQKNDGDGGADR
jgi:hypothetical protein